MIGSKPFIVHDSFQKCRHMRADTAVSLRLYLSTSWANPLGHLCATGWVDPDEASEVAKSYKKTINEVHCLKRQQNTSSCGD